MGSDGGGKHHRSWTNISIHAPRMGSDGIPLDANRISSRFQSTLPGWGATSSWSPASTRVRHFNPRSPDGERLRRWPHAAVIGGISIHAPRMGSDSPSALPKSGFSHFNPRSPDGERLPVSRFAMPSPSNFNPRSPDGERLTNGGIHCLRLKISIHAPRMGSDVVGGQKPFWSLRFQSTLPGWGATKGRLRTDPPSQFQSTLPVWGATTTRWTRSRKS